MPKILAVPDTLLNGLVGHPHGSRRCHVRGLRREQGWSRQSAMNCPLSVLASIRAMVTKACLR